MQRQPRALLIAWDKADWKLLHPLLDRGELPNLQTLLTRGTMGTLSASLPLEHELLWASLSTGRRASGHGILGFAAPEGEAPRPALSQRNCPAFWDFLLAGGLKTHLVNWPMTDGSERTGGVCVSDRFFEISRFSQSAPAAELLSSPQWATNLGELRVNPGEVDDPTLRAFIPDLDRVSREHDRRLLKLARAIARVLSIQAVTTWLMERGEWDVAAVRFDLLADLIPWALPLAAPKSPLVGQLEFDLYRHVLDGACRALDLLLGGLLKWTSPETLVVLFSPHGVPQGEARPLRLPRDLERAGQWKTNEALLILSGPATRRDQVLRGGSLLDIVPTLLALTGVPISSEIEGRVLTNAFTQPIPFSIAESISSWPIKTPLPTVPLPDEADDATVKRTWNFARSLLDAGRAGEASLLLAELARVRPDDFRFMQLLYDCQLALRQLPAARETLERILDRTTGTPHADLARARLEYAARNFEASLMHLSRMESSATTLPRVHLQIGLNLVKLNQSARARSSFEREIEIDPRSAEAHAGLAYCSLRTGEFDHAAQHALNSITLNPRAFYAYFLLGLAQARRSEVAAALTSFQTAVELVPDFAPGHRCLSILYARDAATKDLAQQHREQARATRHWNWGF